MVANILIPGYLRWDGSKFTTDPTVEIVGPPGPPGPPGSGTTTTWQAYTPVFQTVSNDASLNSGVVSGQWRQVGNDTIELVAMIVPGFDTSFGTGDFQVSLPLPATQMTIDTTKALDGGDGYRYWMLEAAGSEKFTSGAGSTFVGQVNNTFVGPTEYKTLSFNLGFLGAPVSGDFVMIKATIPVIFM